MSATGVGVRAKVVARNPCPKHGIVDECPECIVISAS